MSIFRFRGNDVDYINRGICDDAEDSGFKVLKYVSGSEKALEVRAALSSPHMSVRAQEFLRLFSEAGITGVPESEAGTMVSLRRGGRDAGGSCRPMERIGV